MLAVGVVYRGTSYAPRVFHPEHIPERYGLFTLIVLGESVLAVAVGTAGTGWYPAVIATAVFGFVIAACIWWLYFDYVGSSGLKISPRASFFWGYGHLPIYAGIAASGVGILLAIEGAAETSAHGDLGGLAILGGGLAIYLLAVSFIHWVNRGSLDDRALRAARNRCASDPPRTARRFHFPARLRNTHRPRPARPDDLRDAQRGRARGSSGIERFLLVGRFVNRPTASPANGGYRLYGASTRACA